jgi:hemerythrin-like domain-containing protein
MMGFLHHHHHAEEDGLYPLVRQRVPQSAHVLDAMDANHQAMMPTIDRLSNTAHRYADDPSARTALVTALNELAAVMLPHLEREETKMTPVVSSVMTKAKWDHTGAPVWSTK